MSEVNGGELALGLIMILVLTPIGFFFFIFPGIIFLIVGILLVVKSVTGGATGVAGAGTTTGLCPLPSLRWTELPHRHTLPVVREADEGANMRQLCVSLRVAIPAHLAAMVGIEAGDGQSKVNGPFQRTICCMFHGPQFLPRRCNERLHHE